MPYFPLHVTIPEPCSENWDAMTPVDDQRRHCAACDKTLTDFSHMTDRQIGQILRTNGGNLCGRFRRSQLDRPLRLDGPRRRRGLGAIAASAGLLLAAPAFGQGAAPAPTEQVETKAPERNTTSRDKVTIKGVVTDVMGEPLIGVSVLIKGTNTGTVGDLDGYFELELPLAESNVLVFTYVGFATEEIVFTPAALASLAESNEEKPISIVLEDSGEYLGGLVVTCVVREKRSILDNLMVHSVKPIYKAPDYSHRTKNGDWKDYWRDLFAKRKARRAARRAAKQARRAAKVTHQETEVKTTAGSVANINKQEIREKTFNLAASPNPFEQELRVTFALPEAQAISLSLLDANGRLIMEEKYRLQAGKQAIVLRQGVGNLAAGTYFLRLVGKQGAQETIRLVR